jgi:O-antigen ligase
VTAGSEPPPSPASRPSSLALAVLVALAVATPWAFGSVRPVAIHVITLTALLACAVVLLWASAGEGARLPAVPLLPLAGLLALVVLQLVPLPAAVLAVLAPGSHQVWFPDAAAARAVIGGGAHPVSIHPVATARGLLLGTGLCGLAVLAAPALARVPTAIRAAWAVSAAGVAIAVYGIFARARFGSLLYGSIAVPTVMPFGPFVSKNHFAGYVGMAALVACGLAAGLGGGRRASRARTSPPPSVVLAVVAALAMVLGVLVSLSRGGAVSLAAGVVAFLVLRLRDHSGGRPLARLLPSLAVTVVLAGLVLLVLPPEAQGRLSRLTDSSFRLDTGRDTLRLFASSPWLGQGLGSYADAYPRFKRGHGDLRVEHAENDYLETLAEAGLAGLALALAAALLPARRAAAFSAPSALRGLRAGAAGGLAVLLVHSLFDFNLRIPSNAVLAALLASMATAGAPWRPAPGWAARAGAAGFALAALLAWPRTGVPVDPDAAWEAARGEARRAAGSVDPGARSLRLGRTEQALGVVLRQRPAHAEAWLLLAGARAERKDASVAELARHAERLDPERPELRRQAAALGR